MARRQATLYKVVIRERYDHPNEHMLAIGPNGHIAMTGHPKAAQVLEVLAGREPECSCKRTMHCLTKDSYNSRGFNETFCLSWSLAQRQIQQQIKRNWRHAIRSLIDKQGEDQLIKPFFFRPTVVNKMKSKIQAHAKETFIACHGEKRVPNMHVNGLTKDGARSFSEYSDPRADRYGHDTPNLHLPSDWFVRVYRERPVIDGNFVVDILGKNETKTCVRMFRQDVTTKHVARLRYALVHHRTGNAEWMPAYWKPSGIWVK